MTHAPKPDRVPPRGFASLFHGSLREHRVLSGEETAAIINHLHGIHLTEKDVREIEERALAKCRRALTRERRP